MGNVSLKVLEKCLNFFVQKRVQNLFLITFMQIKFNRLSILDGSRSFPYFSHVDFLCTLDVNN